LKLLDEAKKGVTDEFRPHKDARVQNGDVLILFLWFDGIKLSGESCIWRRGRHDPRRQTFKCRRIGNQNVTKNGTNM